MSSSPNTPVSGKLSDESDVDYYKVTLDSAAQFSLCLEHALPDDLKRRRHALDGDLLSL